MCYIRILRHRRIHFYNPEGNTMTDQEKTAEQVAAEKAAAVAAAAAAKKAEKEAAKKAAADAKAELKAKADAEKAAKKAEKGAEASKKAEEKVAKEKEKADKIAAKEAAKAARKQPEQNGVTRRSPGTKTGRVWEICDAVSTKLGQPAPVSEVLKAAEAEGLHPTTTRCQYARWKKFHGLEGRITLQTAAANDTAGQAAS